VTGSSDELNGQAVLMGAASVTAHDHTAPILLGRGGTVRVCQTSELHITESRAATAAAPMMFSIDHGAIEIHTDATLNDTILTPDLRFAVVNKAPLDLRLRVARNGDTCVENRGADAPTLNVSDPFGESLYQIAPGQHVLFEHGSLREVVDHESSPCGCPEQKGMSVADALLASGGGSAAKSPAAVTPVAVAPPAAPVNTAMPSPAAPAPSTVASPAVASPAVVSSSAVARAAATPRAAAPPVAASASGAGAPPARTAPQAPAVASSAGAPPARTTMQAASAVSGASAAPANADTQTQLQAAEQTAAQAAMRAAEAQHPFPEAISEGLAPADAPPAGASAGRVQIADRLTYNAPAPLAAAAPASPVKQPAAQPAAAPPAPPPPRNDLIHVIGQFFKRLFGG